ncbi:uncharacterized protein LOC125648377 [Ostrea edulis]|uniref:uncharacterized protein LOC125648377 n=1 Tax=Ostrea edulis TaxID=37623 RepID=UPI0020958208|nr:uncharacterized protein LOC125648377 [Ostrea edulis]XP_048731362.1 uncharacterized protein LOC125648377 [Ostrea edulis]
MTQRRFLFCKWILLIEECFGLYMWRIIPRMTDFGVIEVPVQTDVNHTTSSCALECEIRATCKLFRINKWTSECDLYDGGGYKTATTVMGNQFYQKVPGSANCITGRDEWFPEYQKCVWIHTGVLNNHEAKARCESDGKIMMGAKNKTQIQSLMNLLNFEWIHVYSRWVGPKSYEWFDGSSIPSSGWWCNNQPYEDTGCLGVDLSMASWCPSGGIDDIICTNERPFFCV